MALSTTPDSASSNARPDRSCQVRPPHSLRPTLLRALYCTPRGVRSRACLRPLNLPLASGSVYVIKNGSKLEIDPSRYNTVRPHWALVPEEVGDLLVPAEVYAGGSKTKIPCWQDWARAARARLETLLEELAYGGQPGKSFAGIVPSSSGARCHPLYPRLASLCTSKTFDSCCPRNPLTKPG